MKIRELVKYLEAWVPKEIAWQKDNVGLQVGSTDREIKNIFLCLELTTEALNEALQLDCNFIITHHPLIFNPLKKINIETDNNSQLIETLIKNNITLYSAHTNLDFTKEGVSFQLAGKLNLKNISFLTNFDSNQYKIVVFVPKDSIEKVSTAIFNAGGGIIGEYSNCSFRLAGKGTFLGSANSNPAAGEKNKLEEVEEIRLEVIIPEWKLNEVTGELKKAHPYDEPAYDVYPLKNINTSYGAGAAGDLEKSMSEKEFLNYVSEHLNIGNFRYTSGNKNSIKKVAVCGGAGSELINKAIISGFDAYITADIKYHTFHDAFKKILLIDAGHYETEIYSLDELRSRIERFLNKEIKIYKFSGSTNPVVFYNNLGA